MGNCLMRNNSKVSAQDHENHETTEKEADAIQQTVVTPMSSKKKKKKTVRFNLQEDEDDGGRGSKNGAHDECKSGAVRIRLVVTQEELKQLLEYYKNDSISNRSSVEQLLSSLRSRSGRRVFKDQSGTNTTDGESWRPVLGSISEDKYC